MFNYLKRRRDHKQMRKIEAQMEAAKRPKVIQIRGTEPGDIVISAFHNNIEDKLEEARQKRRDYWRLIGILALVAIGWILVTYSIAKIFLDASQSN